MNWIRVNSGPSGPESSGWVINQLGNPSLKRSESISHFVILFLRTQNGCQMDLGIGDLDSSAYYLPSNSAGAVSADVEHGLKEID